MTLNDAPDILTVAELQELLRVGRRQLYAMLQDGEIPNARQCRGSWRVPKVSVLEFFGLVQPSAPAGGTGALEEVAAVGAVDRDGG